MRSRRVVLFLSVFVFVACTGNAQGDAGRGWLFFSHTQKLSKKWDVLADVQFRSADNLRHLTTFLFRAVLSRNLNDKHAVGFGYVYKPDWVREPGQSGFQPEHRVHEQYLVNTNLGKTEVTGRVRFEQRFIKPETEYFFSQRTRGFVSFQIPLATNADFSKGLYTTLQNEIFVNVQNKENVNNSFFDQNRLQGGLGYRWSKKVDTDLNYMYWRRVELEGYQTSHVVVLMVTTEL